MMTSSHPLSLRAYTITTYGLCGFANLGSLGIQIGVLSALAPSRSKVIAAKTVAALVLGFVVFLVAIATASLATLVGGADDGFQGVSTTLFALFLVLQLLTILQGLAYGLILLNTPAAIVVFFVLPIAWMRRDTRPEQTELPLGRPRFELPLVPFGAFLAPAALGALLWGDALLYMLHLHP